MFEQVLLQRRKEIEAQEWLENAADLLIRLPQNGIFFQDGAAGYLIRVSPKLGYYKTASLTTN